MPATLCEICQKTRALILRPKSHQKVCRDCFIRAFETEIHNTITSNSLFEPGEEVAIGASGGKDSTVLASVLGTLNERYNYGLRLTLLSIDEGITGYRDDSLETVKRNALQYDMPLRIVCYKELYGWTMDEVVNQVGKKGNCTYCGVFRRQALDRGAETLGIRHVVTGHNADDIAETVLMNLLRGDLPRLARATSILTASAASPIKRSKPLKYAYEKEIVLYAHHKKLDYFSTECIYSPEAFRGSARALIKNLERIRPSAILDVVRSGEDMARYVPVESGGPGSQSNVEAVATSVDSGNTGCSSGGTAREVSEMAALERDLEQEQETAEQALELEITSTSKNERHHLWRPSNLPTPGLLANEPVEAKLKAKKSSLRPTKTVRQRMGQCERCGYLSSQVICKACMLLEGLNRSRPRTSVAVDRGQDDSLLPQAMGSIAIIAPDG